MPLIPKAKKRANIVFAIVLLIVIIIVSSVIIINIINKKNRIKELELNYKEKLTQAEIVLADAVCYNNTQSIKDFVSKNKEFVKNSYSGNRFYSILHFAVETQNYNAAEQLLKLGYNPNVQDCNGRTPLYMAIDFRPYYFIAKKYSPGETLFVKLLLDYKALPDIPDSKFETPLMLASRYLIDKKTFSIPRLLVENGNCDINLLNKEKHSAAHYALTEGNIYLAYYLIVEHKANIQSLLIDTSILRRYIYPLDSEEYKLKLAIIEEFKNQGADYYSEPVPEDIKEKIKQFAPETWEEYIKVY